jgi:hypothetical protein
MIRHFLYFCCNPFINPNLNLHTPEKFIGKVAKDQCIVSESD